MGSAMPFPLQCLLARLVLALLGIPNFYHAKTATVFVSETQLVTQLNQFGVPCDGKGDHVALKS